MTSPAKDMPVHTGHRISPRRRRANALLALVAAACLGPLASAPAPAPAQGSPGSATGKVSVQLVRFLDEVSETDRARFGPLHDVRLRLERGFVVLVRRGGDFGAILPIEPRTGPPDSLQYFWYLERAPFLWVIPGGRDRGVRMVADGGDVRLDKFLFRWGRGGDLGWIYFPDIPENRHVAFSVVSGRSVDRIDPRDTRYWVELSGGPGGGF